MRHRYIAFGAAAVLAACSNDGADTLDPQQPASAASIETSETSPAPTPDDCDRLAPDGAMTGAQYQAYMECESRAYDALEFKPITLTGLVCGDNCYLQYWPAVEGGGDEQALCLAEQCKAWNAAGALPAALLKSSAQARFGTAPQVDAAGNVMRADYPAIVALRFPEDSETDRPASGPAGPAAPAGLLPLVQGVYVLAGTPCASPANAAFAVYDGQGIRGSATRDCRIGVESREGNVYRVRQSCENTYDRGRTSTDHVIEIRAADRFVFRDEESGAAEFRRCEPDELPEFLRKLQG